MSEQTNGAVAPNILVVDDVQENLRLMVGILKSSGYKVRPVTSGPLALEAAKKMPPDLILLDINMPGMNGYEVCEQLKTIPDLADIPVIFLSALNEMEDKVKAFKVGGVDYVTKPFQFEEVHARVECQLKLRQLRLNLETRNRDLAESNAKLREAERLRDDLLHMIVHDMRSPLAAQLGFSELLLTSASPELGERERGWAGHINKTSLTLANMVSSLLDLSRLEAGKMPINRVPTDIPKIAQEALDLYRPLLAKRRSGIESPEPSLVVACDETLTSRVIENLIGNAIKFTTETGSVSIAVSQDEREIRVAVIDDGTGIAPEDHGTIFTKFGQAGTTKRKHSTGIGLAFCKLAIEAQGGQIGVESEPGKGSVFWFTLPRQVAS